MGVISEIKTGNAEMMQDATLKRWHDMMPRAARTPRPRSWSWSRRRPTRSCRRSITDPKFAKAVWDKNIAILEKYNEPGRFTAFIAYEWTSNAGGGDNLHRNVIYRDGKRRPSRSCR